VRVSLGAMTTGNLQHLMPLILDCFPFLIVILGNFSSCQHFCWNNNYNTLKRKTMKIILVSVMAILLVLSSTANGAPARSEKQAKSAVQFRQALLQLVRSNVGALGAMAKGKIPMDSSKIEVNAMRIEQLSLMMPDYFELDTRKFSVDTEALPAIWEDYADFTDKMATLTEAAKALQVTARSGKESGYKAGIGAVLKSCKGCHDSYKAE
jgi:cytochrome c556